MSEPSRGPGHARTRSMETLTPARRVVLDVLGAADGAATIAEVARATGLHLNTVREHLEALVESGLADRGRLAPQGRGRPASTYEYAPQAETLSPGYGLMTTVAIGYLARTFGEGPQVRHHAYRAGRAWGREIVERGLLGEKADEVPGAESLDGVMRSTLGLLVEAGFEPSLHDDPLPSEPVRTEGPEVRLERCPVLTLARENPWLVCEAHLGMVDECLTSREPGTTAARRAAAPEVDGPPVTRMEAFVNPGYCSLFVGVEPDHAGLVVGGDAGAVSTPDTVPDAERAGR